MKNLNVILALVLMLMLTACEGGSGGSTAQSAPDGKAPENNQPSNPSDPVQPIVTPPGSNQVTLTYYTKSFTEAPVVGWPTKVYTVKASCVVYNGYTFCWDDGVKTLQWSSSGNNYGPYRFTYWQTLSNGGHCDGGCTSDLFTAPRFISTTVLNWLDSYEQYSGKSVDDVLATGTPKVVVCTESASQLDCGSDFVIDLTQPTL